VLRYILPALGLAGATYVWHYNTTNRGTSALLLPLLDLVPSLRGNIDAQAMWTWIVAFAIVGIVLAVTVLGHVKERGANSGGSDGG
jgi:hypothetical protein